MEPPLPMASQTLPPAPSKLPISVPPAPQLPPSSGPQGADGLGAGIARNTHDAVLLPLQPAAGNDGYALPRPQPFSHPQAQPPVFTQPSVPPPQQVFAPAPQASATSISHNENPLPHPPPPSYSSNTLLSNNAMAEQSQRITRSMDPYAHQQPVFSQPRQQQQQQQPLAHGVGGQYGYTTTIPPTQTFPSPHQPHMGTTTNHPYAAFDQHINQHINQQVGNDLGRRDEVAERKSDTASCKSEDTRPANTFKNRLKDGLRNVTVSEVMPITILFTAALRHHFKNRKGDKIVPYAPPRWAKHARNMLYLYNSYVFAKRNGFYKSKSDNPPAPAPGTRGIAPGDLGMPSNMYGLPPDMYGQPPNMYGQPPDMHGQPPDMYGQPHSYPGDTGYVAARGLQPGEPAPAPDGYDEGMVHRVRGIVAELFRAPTESMVAQRGEASTYDTPDEFDESWAVPAHLADQCFHRVYNSGESLATIEPHVLGGAAAMMALRNEKDIAQQLGYPTPKDAQYEYQVMLLGLTEAESLVARKAEVTMLYPQDNPDTIGKIALATMIKVKMDAENVPKHQQNCHVQHNSVGHGHMHSQHMPAYHQQQQRPEMMSRHTFH